MVQAIVDRLEGRLDISEVHQPAHFWIQLAAHTQANIECVTMEAATFMVSRHTRESVRCFKTKFLENFHEYGPAIT